MIHHAKARYPEHAETIEALSQTNSGFEELIHRYGHVVESLLGLGSRRSPTISPRPAICASAARPWKKRCCWRSTAIGSDRRFISRHSRGSGDEGGAS